jgi:AAA+ ATPase superfamily predicted ATPase
MQFIGRSVELDLLNREYRGDKGSFVPVFGRRRVGKSQLLVEFAHGKPLLYFTAMQSTNAQNLVAFGRQAAKLTGIQSLATAADWETLLQDTVAGWRSAERRILVIDEIQWAVQAAPELPSLIQRLWDHDWQHRKDLMLILCGSQFGFFRDQILLAGSPLYGRRTAHINLQPFELQEAGQFHPNLSHEDRAQIYFITGGIPYYLQKFEEESVRTNIVRNFLSPQADLATEADFLLYEETKLVPMAKAVLSAIADGNVRYSDIAEATGRESNGLAYHLEPLEEIGFIKKKYPVSPQPASRKLVRYEISDPFLRFWFRFFSRQYDAEAIANPDGFFQDQIQPQLESYWGTCWERLCRRQLPRIYEKEGITCHAEIGEFWAAKTVQIDLVSLRGDKRIELGECRWRHVRSLPALAQELDQKMTHFPNPKGVSMGRRLFVRSYQGAVLGDCRVHTLGDLYKLV